MVIRLGSLKYLSFACTHARAVLACGALGAYVFVTLGLSAFKATTSTSKAFRFLEIRAKA